jgi:S1-C subfamily serine protease
MARRIRSVALAALCVLAGCGGHGAPAGHRAAAQAEPASVVRINVSAVRPAAAGTGWVYDARRGLVVTAFHVTNGASAVEVDVGGRWQRAAVVAAAPCEDVSLLALQDPRGLTPVPLAPASSIATGDAITAGGFPTGDGTPAWRAVGGRVRNPRVALGRDLQGADTPAMDDLLATTRVSEAGMSGGPVLDAHGRLVGMVFADWTGADGNDATFAVRVDRLSRTLDGFERGSAPGWLGSGLYFGDRRGVEVTGLLGGMTGAFPHHGVLVTAVDGTPVGHTFASWCATVGAQHGRSATLTVRSAADGAPGTIRLPLPRPRLRSR